MSLLLEILGGWAGSSFLLLAAWCATVCVADWFYARRDAMRERTLIYDWHREESW